MCTFFLVGTSLFSQVGINNTDPKASLEITASNVANPSNTDGILVPRVDDFPLSNPGSDQDGMVVFLTGVGTPTKGFYYWDNGISSWASFVGIKNTLDQSYDQGGAGSGRSIDASDGAVTINGDDGIIVTGTFGSGNIIDTDISGAGTRLFFNPNKGTIRAGTVSGTQWNDANIGEYSAAFGNDNIASGNVSFAMGLGNTASAESSTAFGSSNTASGQESVTFGNQNTASGLRSIVIGTLSLASGDYSFASGESAEASATNTIALGNGTIANAIDAIAIGKTSEASFSEAIAIAGGNASGGNSVSIGKETQALSYGEVALGLFNTGYVPNSMSAFDSDDRLLSIGNGTTSGNRNNALTILKNGYTGLNTDSPRNPFEIDISTAFDLSYANTGQDGIFIVGQGDNSGANAVGGSISFGPPSTTRGSQRKSAIASVQTSGDVDHTGLAFYVHGNAINMSDMVEGMRLTHNRRLGINNTDPSANLDVIGTMQYQDGNESAGFVMTSDASGNVTWTDPNTLVSTDTDWVDEGSDIERQAGDVYIGDDGATNNDLYISDRLIDWDDATYFVDPGSDNRMNEITFDEGTATDPSIHFDVDTNTGFYRPELDAIGFTSNGVGKISFSARGQIEFFNTGNSVFLGNQAGDNDDASDNQNVGIGNFALRDNTTGNANVGIGYLSLTSSETGASNVGLGYGTLFANDSGSFNVAIGRNALASNNDGEYNIGIGNQTLFDNISGSHNIALGNQALVDVTGDSNIAIGRTASNRITTGTRNIGIGYRAQAAHLTGNDNIVIGERAMDTSTNSSSNVVMGSSALTNMTSGNNNTVIGHTALGSNSGAAPNIANNNVAIGYQAGQTSEGDGNIYIGYQAGRADGVASNHLFIENSSADNTAALIYGEFDNDLLRFNGDVGIGRAPTTNALEVEGQASKTTAGAFVANSDRRLKKNIITLSERQALNKVKSLRGVTYEWNDDKTGTKRPEGIQYGFIAQEIQEVFPEKVMEDNIGYLQTAYGDYDAIFVQAIKALHRKIEVLEATNKVLSAQLSVYQNLEARLEALETSNDIISSEISEGTKHEKD